MRDMLPPVEFDNNDIRDKWVQKFNETMNEICIRRRLPSPLDKIKLEVTDRKACIVLMGTYVAGSNEERAIEDILKAYNTETFPN